MYVRTSRYRLTPEGLADLKAGIREQMMGPITAAPGNRLFAVMTSPDDEQNGLFVSAWDSKEDCDNFESNVRPALYARWKDGFDGPFEVRYWDVLWPGTLQINETSLASPSPMYVRTSYFKLHEGQVETVSGHYEEEVMGPLVAAEGNRFVCVLISRDEERVGSQVTGWNSKEDWERFEKEVYPNNIKNFWHLFEVKPTATFWDLTFPGRVRY